MSSTKHRELAPLMFVGTGSDVGKSILTAGFCRIFLQDGYRPAPFKAQNMALNSFVTEEGLELGRAQAVQAEAAGIPCHTDMNPVLLKPSSDKTSQVILHGRPIGNKDAYQYFRTVGRGELRGEVHAAFDRLRAGSLRRCSGHPRCRHRSWGSLRLGLRLGDASEARVS